MITSGVSDVFARMRARLLGEIFPGPSISFSVEPGDPMDSLESIYRHAGTVLYGPSFAPDREKLNDILEVTANYLEAERLRSINKVKKGIESAETKGDALRAITEAINDATKYVNLLATNEARIVQAYAERDGIERIAADVGVEDPVVAFLGRYDSKTCKFCLHMYHMPNPIIPRAFKLSSVRQGYFKAKEWDGQEIFNAPLHPNCRHVMTFIPPGYGFDASGRITYVGPNYDVVQEQKNQLGKSEPTFGLPPCDCSSHPESPVEPTLILD
jgi:hypothetical protein